MYIVGFNGPPQCGKDTLAGMLADKMDQAGVTLPVFTMPLSHPLRVIAFAMVGRTYSAAEYEDFKVTRFPQFGNITGRQLMIDVSEKFLKPVYGNASLAWQFIARVNSLETEAVILVPDMGFQVEGTEIIRFYGHENFYLNCVYRNGTSFENDSRERVSHRFQSDIENNRGLDELRTEAHRIYGRLVNQMGWKL